ncbi:molybdopterin-dependent oxidoreductase [Pseudonocardia oroxyli]|uniref:DMSO/TMAO reductase YedYZ, molybdopterin-dependent catalytic subunit n=1 Tax=Pseudonocardia oroxyli TaxID=366584 RepID=A0A1G7FZ21_PSEOR|nr:molybdopterin-dependent oxidoreductase [Pseudonocardia oroxyli]SDE81143.1 DMSO/TMAO reductase YedYZ, molybdopterin-dependent catalytic subunit [Pseudonocardia oroxyli]
MKPSLATTLRAPVAIGVLLLAIVAALAAGQLVAGLVAPSSSPFLQVGDAVVRLAPAPVVEFAKSAFGTADKPVLLVGIGVVLLLVAVGAGLASRRFATVGQVTVGVLGVLGIAATATNPTFAPTDLLAPVVAAGVGWWVFRELHRRAMEYTGSADGITRRRFLQATAVVGGLSVVGGGAGVLLGRPTIDSRAVVTARLAAASVARETGAGTDFGLTPYLTPNTDFYRIDTALRVPQLRAEDWSLRVHGMVDRELTLTFDDLLARPLVERTVTLTCVSNDVGGDLISTARFVGVELADVLRAAGPRPGADQVFSTSSDGWTAGTPTEVLLEPGRGALLAVGMNGEALPTEHGFPVRMVVPGLYGYVSATKWVTDLELTTFAARESYWEQRGWGERGPIKTEARIDLPRPFAAVPAGAVTVAGIAWSQPRGISRVEYSVDGGPWAEAELADTVGGDTWRMWRGSVEVGAGSHTMRVRATDGTGALQTERAADVLPDGATGWPAVIFTAR